MNIKPSQVHELKFLQFSVSIEMRLMIVVFMLHSDGNRLCVTKSRINYSTVPASNCIHPSRAYFTQQHFTVAELTSLYASATRLVGLANELALFGKELMLIYIDRSLSIGCQAVAAIDVQN